MIFATAIAETVGVESGVTLSLDNLVQICAIVGALVTIATAYLRLFTANAIKDLRANMVNDARLLREALASENAATYARRELIDLQIMELKRRVQALEEEHQ